MAHALERIRRHGDAVTLFALVERVPVDQYAALPQTANGFQQLRELVAVACGITERGNSDLLLSIRALLTCERCRRRAWTQFQHHAISVLPGELDGLRETHGG